MVEDRNAITQKLPWILYAQRPLQAEELCDGYTESDSGNRQWNFWHSTDIKGDHSRNSGPLVSFHLSTSEIQLCHQSLRSALLDPKQPPSELARIWSSSQFEHVKICLTCLDYLALSDFELPVNPRPDYPKLFET